MCPVDVVPTVLWQWYAKCAVAINRQLCNLRSNYALICEGVPEGREARVHGHSEPPAGEAQHDSHPLLTHLHQARPRRYLHRES